MRKSIRTTLAAALLLTICFAAQAADSATAPAPAPEHPPAAAAPAAAAAPTPHPAPAGAPAAAMVDEVKIVCGEKAMSDGEVHLIFTPAGGAAKDVRSLVAKGMKAKETCSTIATNLKVILGSGYEVKDSGGKVKLEGKKGAKFSLVLGTQTVSGLTVSIQ